MDGLFTRALVSDSRLRGGRDGGDLNPGYRAERRYPRRFVRAAPKEDSGVYIGRATTGVLHNSLHNIIGRGMVYAVSGQARLRTGSRENADAGENPR